MKIRVYYGDGGFRGGFLDIEAYSRNNCRVWDGPARGGFREYLWDISRPEERPRGDSWFALYLAKKPKVRGPRGDEYDPDSHAVRLTPAEALRWFRGKSFAPPEDLRALAGDEPAARPRRPAKPSARLGEALQEVWDALSGRALSAKELANTLSGHPHDPDAIRKRIASLRAAGRVIERDRSLGYYRPDAPPPDLE